MKEVYAKWPIFIYIPIFSWVLAIILCLAGVLCLFSLPIEQYPNLATLKVRINASYPGASAETLENTVTQIIEQNMTGLDNLLKMAVWCLSAFSTTHWEYGPPRLERYISIAIKTTGKFAQLD